MSGTGIWSKLLNGGKPFIDDFEVLVKGDVVEFYSSSRVGESDMGVNAKRVAYIRDQLKGMGWS